MFYCSKCAKENGYPITISKSYGACELCEKIGPCNDMPCKDLPGRKETEEQA